MPSSTMPSCSCGWLWSGTVGARLEADEVEHRALAEERLAAHSGGELERADGVESDELRLAMPPIIVARVSAV